MKYLTTFIIILLGWNSYSQDSYETIIKLGAANSGSIEGINYTLNFQKVTDSQLIYGIQAQLLDADIRDETLNAHSVFGTFGLQSRSGTSNVFQGNIGIGPTVLNINNGYDNVTVLSATASTRYIKELNQHLRLGLDVALLINKEIGFADVGLFLGYVF
jgi:hypothetical protein